MKYIGIVLVAAMAIAACNTEDAATTATSDIAMDARAELPGIAVEGKVAEMGSLVGRIESSGIVRGIGEAWVISETQGVIESVLVTLGDEVEEGAPLLTLDAGLQELQLAQAEAQLESARLDLATAERLYNSGNASKSDLARARSAAVGAQAAAENARRSLLRRTLRAPISGRIADKEDSITRGNYLSAGNRVARVIDTTRLRVEVALGEREIQFVERGARAVVTLPACGAGPFDATVVGIAAASDRATGSFPVIVEWPNECGDRVRVGMSATVSIPPVGEPRILVPVTAVLEEAETRYVFVAEDGVASRREVSLGQRLGNAVEIAGGLDAGSVVLTSGLSRVTDGAAVSVTVTGDTGAL